MTFSQARMKRACSDLNPTHRGRILPPASGNPPVGPKQNQYHSEFLPRPAPGTPTCLPRSCLQRENPEVL